MGNGAEAVKTRWIPGAVSATFRRMEMSAEAVTELLADCGLQAVEWSENVHVAPGDPEGASILRRKTEAAGLQVAAYGSYYRLGEQADPVRVFSESLASASALCAPVIRIWAGTQPSDAVDDAAFHALAQEAAQIADLAEKASIRVAFEWHKNTLTDTNASALRLLTEANHPNLYCLWQPTGALTPRERAEGIRLMGEKLINFHVYSWPDGTRGPLNAAEWQYYFDAAAAMGGTHCALLEFVRDDTVEQFRSDAQTLITLLNEDARAGE